MINTIFLLDKNKKIVDSLSNNGDLPKSPFFNDRYVQQLATGAETYEFSTFSNERTNKYCQGGGYVAFKYNNKVKMFQIMELEDEHKEGKIVKSCYCEVAGLELINSTFRERESASANIKQFMDMALEGTSWSLGILDVGITSVLSISVDKPVNVYSFLQTYIPKFGAEIEFRVELNGNRVVAQYIDVYSKRGRETRKRFEHGQNISAISRKIDFSNIATALIGRGKNNIDFKTVEWLSDKPALKPLNQDFIADEGAFATYNKNGEHIMGIYENSECESPDELLVLTWNALQERKNPKFSYDVKTEMILGDESEINIGDTIYVIDNDYEPALYLSARVGQLDMSFSDHTKNKCTLTNYREVKSGILSLSTIQAIIDGKFPIGTGDIQDGAINGDKLHNGQIITGTHLFANSVTADKIKAGEITADHIATGSITADKVQAGLIEVGSTIIADGAITTKHIAAESINAGHINAGSVNADHIAAGTIVSGSGIIAEGAIGSAQISNLEADKISAGIFDTSKITVAGPNGNLTLRGNRMQVFSGHGNEQFERVSLGDVDNDGTKYGLRVRGEDGTTILYDENGVYQEGITDGSINNDKISGDANIDGYKLNINSVIREVNGATETISGTKISVDGTNLEVKLSEQETTITEQGKEIKSNTTRVEANEDQIKLKVDEQKYTQDMAGVNGILEKHSASIEVNKDAITNKVSAAWVQEQGYQTESQVQQTVDRWEAKFSESGGFNLLRNSAFKNGTAYWNSLRWDNQAGGAHTIEVRHIGDYWTLTNRNTLSCSVGDLPPSSAGLPLRAGFDSDTFVVRPNATYTLTCLLASHRIESITIEMLCYDSNGNRIPDSNYAVVISNLLSGGRDRNNWTKVKHTWTTSGDAVKCHLRAFMNEWNGESGSGVMWIGEPIITDGDSDVVWTPCADEVYDGIVALDKDGVKVSMADGVGLQGFTRTAYDGLSIYDSKGNRTAWFGEGNSAFIRDLEVTNRIRNPYLIQNNKGRPVNLFVASTATGDGTGRNEWNKANSINHTLQWIKDNYGVYSDAQDLNIYIDAGVYNEHVYIGGWIGMGQILLHFNPNATIYGSFRVEECTQRVYVGGGRTGWNDNNGCVIESRANETFTIRNSVVQITGFRARPSQYPNYGSNFIYLLAGSRVQCDSNDLVKYHSMFIGGGNTSFHSCDNKGDVSYLTNQYYTGQYYFTGVYHPLFENGHITNSWNSTGVFNENGANSQWIPKDVAPPPPPSNWQWVEQTFSLYNLRTVPEGSGSGTSGRTDSWGQGKWSTYKPHRGYADIGDEPANFSYGGRNFTAWLTMRRLDTSHGNNSNSPRPKIKRTDGQFWDSGVGFNRGEWQTIQLPNEILVGIINGSMKTLEMWAGTAIDQYSFYDNVSIKIKCEKQV